MCLGLVAIGTGKFRHQLRCSGHVPFLLCKMSLVHFLVRWSYHLSLLDLQDFSLLFLINTGWLLFISYPMCPLLTLMCVFKKEGLLPPAFASAEYLWKDAQECGTWDYFWRGQVKAQGKECLGGEFMCPVSQWFPTLCNPMHGSPPGSSVHGIYQARILKSVAISSSRGSSRPRDRTCVFWGPCIGRWVIYTEPRGKPHGGHVPFSIILLHSLFLENHY